MTLRAVRLLLLLLALALGAGCAGRVPEPAAAEPLLTLPADVPPYPGSHPLRSVETPGLGVTWTYASPEGTRRVAPAYRALLAQHGWRMRRPAWEKEVANLVGTKAERMLGISVTPSQQGTTLEIVVIEPPSP